jgi:hypothetical protein
VHPRPRGWGGRKKKRRGGEQVKVSGQAGPAPRSHAHSRGQPRLLGCRASSLEPKPEWPQLGLPLQPAWAPRSRRWDNPGSGRQHGVRGEPSTCHCAPGWHRPGVSACWQGAGSGDLATTSYPPPPPPRGPGSCPEGGHFPPSLSPCWPSPQPRAAQSPPGAQLSPSRPLFPATFRALFSGWKCLTEASWTGSPPGGQSSSLRCVTFSSPHQLWMETNKEESILHEPLLGRREASCSREGAADSVRSPLARPC